MNSDSNATLAAAFRAAATGGGHTQHYVQAAGCMGAQPDNPNPDLTAIAEGLRVLREESEAP